MSLFHKKDGQAKPVSEELYSVGKIFRNANLTPVDYTIPPRDQTFLDSAEEEFRRIIQQTDVDDLCSDMLDAYIDARIDEMKVSACDQYTRHIATIYHHEGLLAGEISQGREHLLILRADLEKLEAELEQYLQLRKAKYSI